MNNPYLYWGWRHQTQLPMRAPEMTSSFHIHIGKKTHQKLHVIVPSRRRANSSEKTSRHVYTTNLLQDKKYA